MLAREIIERTQSTYLWAGNNHPPAWDVQDGSLTNNALTMTVEGRLDRIPNEGTLEWDDDSMELALVKSVAATTVTFQERGYLETEAATHTDGTRVLIDNPYPKAIVFDALKTLIGMLYGFGLYRRNLDASRTLNNVSPVALDALDKDVASTIWWRSGSQWLKLRKGTHFEVIHEVSPIEIQFWGYGAQGSALRMTTKRDFTRPTALTDDLDNLGLSTSLQEGLSMGVAGLILQGRDVPLVQADHIRRSLEMQNAPVGTASNLGRMLWTTFVQQYVSAERMRLMESNPPSIVHGG
jgi:hypothetical protein